MGNAVYSGNIFLLIRDGVLYTDDSRFAYLDDLSNSLCLSLLYFLSGYFPLKFDEFINKGISKELFRDMSVYAKEREESKIWLCAAGLILFCIVVRAGCSFYYAAKANGKNMYWIYKYLVVL